MVAIGKWIFEIVLCFFDIPLFLFCQNTMGEKLLGLYLLELKKKGIFERISITTMETAFEKLRNTFQTKGNKQWEESGHRTSSRQQEVFTGGVINVCSMYSYIYEVSITNKCFQEFVLGTHELKVFIPLVSLRTIHRITEYLEFEGVHKDHTKAIFW